MKKLISIVLVASIALMCLAFAGCNSTKDENNNTGNGESAATLSGESAPLLSEVEITKDFTVADDFKLGVILLHDEDSTYDLNFLNGVNRAKEALGLTDEQVIIKKNIDESDACYEAAKDLANNGCKLIFADSFGHEDYMIKAAKEFPDVQFCHATGTKAHTEGLKNYHNAFASIYEGRYLAGIVAGMKLNEIKEAGKLKGDVPMMGYVGAFTYAEVISGYTSFYLGAKSVCPDVQMKVQFTGSWYDEKEEKTAAQALIDSGCDLISQHADSMGAPTACEDAGIPNVSYNGSTFESAEGTFLVSSRIDWSPYFAYIIKMVNEGKEIATDWTGSITTGSVLLSGINQGVVADGTKEAVDKAIAEFKAGTLHVFNTANFTVGGKALSTYKADVDTDAAFTPDTEVIKDGYFAESADGMRSAPYFDLRIDGIELVNEKY